MNGSLILWRRSAQEADVVQEEANIMLCKGVKDFDDISRHDAEEAVFVRLVLLILKSRPESCGRPVGEYNKGETRR